MKGCSAEPRQKLSKINFALYWLSLLLLLKMAPRKYYSISQKYAMVQELNLKQEEEGFSLRAFARQLGVDASQLRRWQQQSIDMKKLTTKKGRGAVKTLHAGYKCCINQIEEDLLRFIFENREQGFSVSIRMVLMKAANLDTEFRRKTDRAKDQIIRRFVKSHGLVHRVHTHESQKAPAEVHSAAKDYILSIRPMLTGNFRNQKFILNMDQTPVFFSMLPRTTLNESGARTVNVRTSTNSTMRVTVAVCVTASGEMLKPLLVFKGKPGGRIEREFNQYNKDGLYTVQEKAWMDEMIMKVWVEKFLKPFVESAARSGCHPVLILDSYRCHMMASIVGLINDLGVQVEHIPGGCTGLCQPVDVGIGKPLKNRIRNFWEEWMMEKGIETTKIDPAPRSTIADWVVSSLQSLDVNIIRNSWRHGEYSYFVDESNDLNTTEENNLNITEVNL